MGDDVAAAGPGVRLRALGDGLAELVFDRAGEAINKFDARTVAELREAVGRLASDASLRGVLVTSAKEAFIVGADITEFLANFTLPEGTLAAQVAESNSVFDAFEDLPVPSVIAINGIAFGGGLEMALTGAWRVMSETALVGLPEVRLGLFPGFGGTVRLPRIAGAVVAIDWVGGGAPSNAAAALAAGVVDEVVAHADLRDASLAALKRAVAGDIDWRARQQRKRDPLPLSAPAREAVFAAALERLARTGAAHQPAAAQAVRLMAGAAPMDRRGALAAEHLAFARIAKTQAASALVQAFLSDQALKKLFRQHARQARPVRQAAVVGAGTLGGGIAFASALKGVPVRLQDISQAQLDLGLDDIARQLARRVEGGRLAREKAAAVLAAVQPQRDDAGFGEVDLAIETGAGDDLGARHRVLAALEGALHEDAVIATSTAGLGIDELAAPLRRPHNLVGMRFFEPVPTTTLVEVVRGSRSSDAAVATAAAHAVAMGKTPIVVKDGPGLLVDRVLTAYVRGFLRLVADGADFERVDRAMEAFGWAMGPALLQDVAGLDAGSRAVDVISAGHPDRMPALADDALKTMVRHGRLGRKTGLGFYRHETDPQGRPTHVAAADTRALLAPLQPHGVREFPDAAIVERLMLPMIVEAAHALEEGVVATPAELDQALLLGLGCPAYLGGALKYADWLGLAQVVERCDALAALGPACRPTERMRAMASQCQTYYPKAVS